MKVFRSDGPAQVEELALARLCRCTDAHVPQLLGSAKQRRAALMLELAFCDGVQLAHALARITGGPHMPTQVSAELPADAMLAAVADVSVLLHGVARAIFLTHEAGLAHNDIRPENILFTSRLQLPAKLGVSPAELAARQPEPEDTSSVSSARSLRSISSSSASSFASSACDEPAHAHARARGTQGHGRRGAARAAGKAGSVIPVAQLADFALCSDARQACSGEHGPHLAAWGYAAPEVAQGMLFAAVPSQATQIWGPPASATLANVSLTAADIWAWGITLFSIVTGAAPFTAALPSDWTFRAFVRATQPHVISDPALQSLIAPGVWTSSVGPDAEMAAELGGGGIGRGRAASQGWAWPRCVPPLLRHLILQCLQVDPAARATASDCMNHPWWKTALAVHSEHLHPRELLVLSVDKLSERPLGPGVGAKVRPDVPGSPVHAALAAAVLANSKLAEFAGARANDASPPVTSSRLHRWAAGAALWRFAQYAGGLLDARAPGDAARHPAAALAKAKLGVAAWQLRAVQAGAR